MAIAVFTDIHGNLEALEAILHDIHKNRHKIEHVYFLGDAVTFGSDSSACLKLLKEHKVTCVVGNNEQRLFRYEKAVAQMSPSGIKHMEYIFNSLDNDDIAFIKSMPLELTLDYKGARLYFAHYSHDENGVVHEDMDTFREDLLDKWFNKIDADAVFIGHLHERKIYIRDNHKSYFCLGSSGFTRDDVTNYTLFDVHEKNSNNFIIYREDVKYDRAKFERKIYDREIPEKELFAKRYFGIDLNPKPAPKKVDEDLDND